MSWLSMLLACGGGRIYGTEVPLEIEWLTAPELRPLEHDEPLDEPLDDTDEDLPDEEPPWWEAVAPADVAYCTDGVAAILGVSTPYPNVREALYDAHAGDVVSVCPGTWARGLLVTDGPVALIGYGREVSVLSGNGTDPVLTVEGGAVYVADLTMTRGHLFHNNAGGALRGGAHDVVLSNVHVSDSDPTAIVFDGPASLTILGSTLSGNQATGQGAAIHLREGDLYVADSVFEDNTAVDGGAIYVSGPYLATPSVHAVRTRFSGNQATETGGAMAILGAEVTLTDCVVEDSQASRGGAFYVTAVDRHWNGTTTPAHLTVRGGSVLRNAAVREDDDWIDGGAMTMSSGADLVVIDSDWGTGDDDNFPRDVSGRDMDFGPHATFACTSDGCE
jgi:predicted outer membrane repeat protein